MSKQYKLDWMRSLKIGDYVCDCNFKHQKISSVKECSIPNTTNFTCSILNQEWIPNSVYDILWGVHDKFCRIFGFYSIIDKDLILEDGSNCSAMNCCDQVNHTWKHPAGK